jgi:23S rRNA (uracil1939-C5)-methyltransferase
MKAMSNYRGTSVLIDAYCGAGFFAKRLRQKFTRVIGFDWDVHAIAAAQSNATSSESYFAGNLPSQLREHLAQIQPDTAVVIVDPPATGLGSDVREALRRHPSAMLFYVSCNPPTLARDLAELGAAFRIESVTPFDMFPQTAEIEVLAHLAKA